MWWSADSTHLAYLEINDTGVPVYHYPDYGAQDNIYGDIEEIPYPKVSGSSLDALNIAVTCTSMFRLVVKKLNYEGLSINSTFRNY